MRGSSRELNKATALTKIGCVLKETNFPSRSHNNRNYPEARLKYTDNLSQTRPRKGMVLLRRQIQHKDLDEVEANPHVGLEHICIPSGNPSR
jgi:hypothetical protein